jgi:hypothetical protein
MLRSKLESRLEAFVAGEVDDATRTEIETLLARDANARRLHDEIREAHDALQILRDRPEPPFSAEDALPRIVRAMSAHAFTGKPPLELQSWATVFYRRVAVAALLLCGVSMGLFLHNRMAPPPAIESTPVATPGLSTEDRTFNVRGGTISGLDWMNLNGGNLVTFTPTDAVMPLIEQDPAD